MVYNLAGTLSQPRWASLTHTFGCSAMVLCSVKYWMLFRYLLTFFTASLYSYILNSLQTFIQIVLRQSIVTKDFTYVITLWFRQRFMDGYEYAYSELFRLYQVRIWITYHNDYGDGCRIFRVILTTGLPRWNNQSILALPLEIQTLGSGQSSGILIQPKASGITTNNRICYGFSLVLIYCLKKRANFHWRKSRLCKTC